jgi:hypothetical protein
VKAIRIIVGSESAVFTLVKERLPERKAAIAHMKQLRELAIVLLSPRPNVLPSPSPIRWLPPNLETRPFDGWGEDWDGDDDLLTFPALRTPQDAAETGSILPGLEESVGEPFPAWIPRESFEGQ